MHRDGNKERDLRGVKCVRGSPRANAQASAAPSVHPVPCVLFESKYGLTNNVYLPPPSSSSPTSHRTSTTTGTSRSRTAAGSCAAAWNRISIFAPSSCCLNKPSHTAVILYTRELGSSFVAVVAIAAAAASTSAVRKPPCAAAAAATCPPLTSTARGPSAHSSREARTISSIEDIFILRDDELESAISVSPTPAQRRSSASASAVFGVSTVARGRSSSMSASSASFCGWRSAWPDVDTQTGSSTSGGDGGDCWDDGSMALRICPTVRIMSALASMPVLMAAMLMSSRIDRICDKKTRFSWCGAVAGTTWYGQQLTCSSTNVGGTACTACTPFVFCAVRAVTAEAP